MVHCHLGHSVYIYIYVYLFNTYLKPVKGKREPDCVQVLSAGKSTDVVEAAAEARGFLVFGPGDSSKEGGRVTSLFGEPVPSNVVVARSRDQLDFRRIRV